MQRNNNENLFKPKRNVMIHDLIK